MESSSNHFLFVDDLKLFERNEGELEKLVDLVGVYSKDIWMEFGLDKCAVVVIKKSVKVRREVMVLPSGNVMRKVI